MSGEKAASAAQPSLAADRFDARLDNYVILPALPFRVRLRLRVTKRIDVTACWLVEHDRPRAAICLWKVTGLWR